MFCQGIEPQLVFPEKPFENYNCTQFINDSLIISPFHNSVRIYGRESESLILHHTVFLDADPIAITQNARKISIIDWNSVLYILNKEDYRISKKIHLDIPPKELTYIGDELIVLSDSAYLVVKGDSIFESIKVNSYIQGISARENAMKTITSDGIFLTNNIDSVQKISPIKSSKFKGNTFFNQDAFKVISSIENEIYCVKSDSFFSIPKNMEAVVKVKTSGVNCFLLDSAGVLSTYNLKNNNFLFVSKDVLDFELTDTSLLLLKPNLIILMNLFGTDTILKIPVPKIYDARRLMAFNHSLLITYSDLSFLFYSFQINKWYRVNEKSGFKGNLLLANDEIICSGDSHVFKYSLTNKRTDLIKDLYTFSTTTQGNILYYGSENNQQRDSLLLQVIDKHDPLNASSIRKVELFLSGLVVHFYNDKLIIICNEKERIILNSSYFEKLSDSEILYENSNNLYYINLESQDEVLLDSNIKTPSISFKLRDNSIVTLGTAGNAKRYYFNSTITSQAFSFPEEYAFSSIFKDQSQGVYLTTWNGYLLKFNEEINQINALYKNNYPLFAGSFNNKYQVLGIVDLQGQVKLFYAKNHTKMLTLFTINNTEKLFVDNHGRFDGTPGAIDYLYLTCGLEVIDLAQVKDSLWVPGLVEKIMNGDSILINDRPAPKLKDLNICDLTPVIEPIDKGDKGLYRYKIIPRNGGLGETEVYINGNLTYKFKPEQLQKKLEQKKEVYYLSFSSDTLQGFLTGEKNSANPILVKAKVKGSGIYGRGAVLDVVKTTEKENPKFYAVFIGVNDYGNPTKESSAQRYRDLDFAKKDADDLANAVEATARNLFKEDCRIYRLTGTGNSDSVPSKANLQNVLKEIGENAKASDILYIFFAGHGDIPEKSGEKEIRFILHKADKKNVMSSSFGVEELTEWCHPKNIKAQKRVLVFDACHSGQIINQTMAFNGRGDDEATRIRQLDRLKDKNGMMILAAAADNESAYEDETLNQGVLTYHLLQVMKEQTKDTSLEIRSWFDETIDLVKDYSRANGNQQEPNSFGDGRFEIGNINDQVRQNIDISCPKTRIGMCVFSDPTGEAEALYPKLKEKVNQYFTSASSRGSLVFSKNLDKAYRVEGTYILVKKKVQIRYKVFIGETQLSEAISLPATKGQTEEELVAQLAQSITAEIERLDKRDEKCKNKKK